MADLTTLRALKARVDAATGADRELDRLIMRDLDLPPWAGESDASIEFTMIGSKQDLATPALTASIDAAVGLVERLLPQRRFIEIEIHPASADVEISMDYGDDWFGGDNDRTPPLAILSALLAALIAQAEAGAEESAALTPPSTTKD